MAVLKSNNFPLLQENENFNPKRINVWFLKVNSAGEGGTYVLKRVHIQELTHQCKGETLLPPFNRITGLVLPLRHHGDRINHSRCRLGSPFHA